LYRYTSDGCARAEPPSAHLLELDFGPGCDACGVEGPAGDRRVVATKDIKRGSVVIFEAPMAAVKAGEPVASWALVRAFAAFAARVGSSAGAGRVGVGIGLGAEGEGGEMDEAAAAAAGANVPHEWILAQQLLRSGALGARPPRAWAREYAQAQPAAPAADGGAMGGTFSGGAASFEAEVAAEVAAEVGGGVTLEDVSAVHRVACANAFALEAMCTRLHYGAGFFQAAAYMNHSCDPSCLSLRLGGNMAVFAARDVAAGEELTHSYLPSHQLLLPRAARQPLLFFDCRCPRCAKDIAADDVLAGAPTGLEQGLGVHQTALGRAALEVRTAAVTGGDGADVLHAFATGVLGARERDSSEIGAEVGPGSRKLLNDRWEVDAEMLETLKGIPHQAAIELLEPVLDAHWRAALEAGQTPTDDGGSGTKDRSGVQRELQGGAPPPDAAVAAVAARVWRDAADGLRTRAALEGRGVAAVAEQVYAAAEVSLFVLEAAEGGGGGDEAAARRALMFLVSAHGDSLACAQEDALCLRSMPSVSAAAAPFEQLLATAAVGLYKLNPV
jgi:hypothetical protein